jgi:hypothetical protein
MRLCQSPGEEAGRDRDKRMRRGRLWTAVAMESREDVGRLSPSGVLGSLCVEAVL